MIVCDNCNMAMKSVMSFSKDKNEKFNRCSKRYSETRHKKLREDELSFGEVLHKELHKK